MANDGLCVSVAIKQVVLAVGGDRRAEEFAADDERIRLDPPHNAAPLRRAPGTPSQVQLGAGHRGERLGEPEQFRMGPDQVR